MLNQTQERQSESGNVLFLILIAVALFAALSYVVTQSTRSGGGSTEREKNILSSAQMTQYPTALRTSLIRMVLGGTGIENVKFNSPDTFGSISSSQLVFHPQGGGATYQQAPADLSSGGNLALNWYFNANFYVPGIGIDTSGGNDIIAFLPGVSTGVCKQVNEELGINVSGCASGDMNSGVPKAEATVLNADIIENMDNTYTFPGGPGVELQGDGTCNVFTRQASGCFYDVAGTTNVFYSVLLER